MNRGTARIEHPQTCAQYPQNALPGPDEAELTAWRSSCRPRSKRIRADCWLPIALPQKCAQYPQNPDLHRETNQGDRVRHREEGTPDRVGGGCRTPTNQPSDLVDFFDWTRSSQTLSQRQDVPKTHGFLRFLVTSSRHLPACGTWRSTQGGNAPKSRAILPTLRLSANDFDPVDGPINP